MSKDYYQTLGISKNASQDEVKAAFRRLAIEHHPDKGGNAEKFKEINEAYQVLGDDGKRKQYDQFGSGFENMNRGGFGGQNPFGQGFGGFQGGNINFEDLGDIFGDFFGRSFSRGARREHSRKGRNIEADLAIDFLESVFGTEKEIELYKDIECPSCGGSGVEPGSRLNTCSNCSGKGKIYKTEHSLFGTFRVETVCPSCKGMGKKPEKECGKCRGKGILKGNKIIEVKIPAGVSDGETLRLSGQGEAGSRGSGAGDLYINLRVRKHPDFIRDGFNIISQCAISFPEAALGARKDLKTVDGGVEFKIPAGIQSGEVMKLKGKGVPYLRGSGRGDHLVEIIVETPKHLSRRQKKLVEDLRDEMK